MPDLKGKLKITKNGFGIILTNDPKNKIKVDKKDLNNNFNGDEVIYKIKKVSGLTQYVEIISEPNYKNRDFLGIVHHNFKKDVFVYNFNIGKNNLVMCDTIFVDGNIINDISNIVFSNNFVKFKITRYKNKLFYGHIIENYGSFDNDEALSKYIINFNNLSYQFSEKLNT